MIEEAPVEIRILCLKQNRKRFCFFVACNLVREADKLEHGSEKAAQRALQNAIQEKSRYVAERIARTEGARARYDAFIANCEEDEDVVAYKWKLGSRHPAEDICDMYANADLYGLGKGVFPKDKVIPQPAHPHCLCHYAPVYWGEIRQRPENR